MAEYLDHDRSFAYADAEKRDILSLYAADILSLYAADIMKIDARYRSRVRAVFEQIPGFLSCHEKRVVLSDVGSASFERYHDAFFWLADSMIANECFNCNDPNVGLALNEDRTYIKCYMGDTGLRLLVSHTFDEAEIERKNLYRELLTGKLSINEGMFFENAVMQELTSSGYRPYFYTRYNTEKHRNDIEVDFLISNRSKTNCRIFPIEVKSTDRYSVKSLERFLDVFGRRVGQAYVIHTKNLRTTERIKYLSAYMTMCI